MAKRKTKRTARRRSFSWWWLLALGGVALLAAWFYQVNARPEVGEALPIEGAQHVPEGTDPGPYNTLPPASGKHYASPLQRGFYEEEAWGQVPYPEGYLVHNLEHGYVIFWYNCEVLSEEECQELKAMIFEVMQNRAGYKLIAFPYPKQEEPLVITSWGRQMRMWEPNLEDMYAFVDANHNRAPEPGAP